MPPKRGQNSKAVEAQAKKDEAKKDKDSKAKAAEEDAYWAEAEGKKGKAAKKKEDEAKKKEETAAKKAEAKRLAAEEEAALAKLSAKKAAKPQAPKVTQHALRLQSESEKKTQEADLQQRAAEKKRVVSEDQYSRLVEVENRNADDSVVEARSVTEAISVLGVDDTGEDRHPERRAKAAWNAYYNEQLPLMREEKPGLKLNQYKDMIWKTWQKSPHNPMNKLNEK